MNNFKKYIIWFVIWLLWVWTITYAAWNGTIGDLFVQVWNEWKLTWDSIQDNTIDNSEIEYSDTYTIDQLWIWTSTPTEKLDVVWNVLADQYLVRSDSRFKKDIIRLNNSLENILSLNWYSYIFKSTWKKDIWLIAQEVEEVYPDLVHTWNDWYKSVQYQNLVAPLIEAIKAQQVQIDNLQKEIEVLKNK